MTAVLTNIEGQRQAVIQGEQVSFGSRDSTRRIIPVPPMKKGTAEAAAPC